MAFVIGFCDIKFIVVPDDRLSLDSLKGLRGIHSQAYSSFILVIKVGLLNNSDSWTMRRNGKVSRVR